MAAPSHRQRKARRAGERDEVSLDQRGIRRDLREIPLEGSVTLVRYGDGPERRLKILLRSQWVRPLPLECR